MARRLFPTIIALLLLIAAIKVRAQEKVKVLIEPAQVKVGLFYGGQKIHVLAETPSGHDVVIKVSGKNEDLELKKKGKKGGVLWMNVGELDYHAVPSLFMIRSSRPLENLSSREVLKGLGIGYGALEAEVTTGADDDARPLFNEFIKLKEKEGLFSINETGVEIKPPGSGSGQASTTFFLPPKVPRGEYRVEVFGFKDGEGSLLGTGTIKLDFTPAMAFISRMAKEHGLVYGCLASAIAIFAGLITGYIFGSKGKTH